MAYRIKIEHIGQTGAPSGYLAQYEAETELEAVAIAAYEVDIARTSRRPIATVLDPSGLLILAYVGRPRLGAGDARR